MDERLERALDRNATRLERETEGRLERSLVRRALRRLAERTEGDMDGRIRALDTMHVDDLRNRQSNRGMLSEAGSGRR